MRPEWDGWPYSAESKVIGLIGRLSRTSVMRPVDAVMADRGVCCLGRDSGAVECCGAGVTEGFM